MARFRSFILGGGIDGATHLTIKFPADGTGMAIPIEAITEVSAARWTERAAS